MSFEELLDAAVRLLQRRRRLTYGALKRQFDLDDDALEDLRVELIHGQRVAVDEDGLVLVWSEDAPARLEPTLSPPAEPLTRDAERRQLTVLFCDLVDSTALASQLDPEELRQVLQAYHEVCGEVIDRFDGHIAQYLGDGLLVYFGYPLAHEDDAQRAVRAGLDMVEALGQLNAGLEEAHGVRLAARMGAHTGPVVVGEVGHGSRQEQLALGETPNLAARLQGIAAPNSLVVSATTFQLLGGFFACEPLGTPTLKGIAQAVGVYRVLYESTARSRLEAAGSTGLTPLVGREPEIGILQERWAQVKDGLGQVVLLSGEAGIGKSRLVQVLKDQVAGDPQAWLTACQCSPYHQNTALYPLIDLLERTMLRFEREDSQLQKLNKLEQFVAQYGLPPDEATPLFASLLSLPLTTEHVSPALSPEQQKRKTLRALLTMLLHIAAQQRLLFVMEDLHWIDPSTLELLNLLVDQGPTARILALLAFRPDFVPPWTGRSHLTQVTLHRLPRREAAELAGLVARRKALPPEVVEQVVAKTDGVPLFVEELTKMVLESGLLHEGAERYDLIGPLPSLAIPATLHDSLMARLDRLATVKALAQLGATLGREFSYELVRAVAPWDEETLQRGLQQLVAAEFLFQQGLPPDATYRFKHALIQGAAYESLLRSTRQRHHQRIAEVVEVRFPQLADTQPELLAHHFTEAGINAQAIPYWLRAGQRAMERSANVEAINHLTKGLELLETLPDSTERALQELTLQATLGMPLTASKGFVTPEVERVYARAWELSRQVEGTPQLFPVLLGLLRFYLLRGELETARELGERLYSLAERVQDPALLLEANRALGATLFWLGELSPALGHLEQAIALYEPGRHRSHAVAYGLDPMVFSLLYAALTLWVLGYPTRAMQRSSEGLALAYELAHPYSLGFALSFAAMLHQFRGEWQSAQERAEAAIAISDEQGFPFWSEWGTSLRSEVLAEKGRGAESIALIRGGHGIYQTSGRMGEPYHLALMSTIYGKVGRAEEGVALLAEGLSVAGKTGARLWEAELHRLRGELLLAVAGEHQQEAVGCFLQAIEIARRQGAKSLELRAACSLSRLWHKQRKGKEARELLTEIFGWFTEGFDTADLKEAKALLAGMTRPPEER